MRVGVLDGGAVGVEVAHPEPSNSGVDDGQLEICGSLWSQTLCGPGRVE